MASSVLVPDLEPHAQYDVRVAAGTSAGYYEDENERNWPWRSATTSPDSAEWLLGIL